MRQPETISSNSNQIDRISQLDRLTIPKKDGTLVPVADLAQRFYDSPHGREMVEQPLRFSVNFGYERDAMLSDLGPDVCPVGHMSQSVNFLQQIVDQEQESGSLLVPSEKELAIVAFALKIHDFGETMHEDIAHYCGGVLGDKPAGTKTDDDKALESEIRHLQYYAHFSDIDPEVISRVEAIVSHQDQTILHDYYEAAHNLQTMDTVRRADAYLASVEAVFGPLDERTTALMAMSRQVKPTTVGKLREYTYFDTVRSLVNHEDQDDSYGHFVTAENASYHRHCPDLDCRRLAIVATSMGDTARLAA